MEITHTITVLELVWTLVALIGLMFSVGLLVRSIGDRRWLLHENTNGDRDLRIYVSVTSILIFAGGAGTQLAYLAVGLIALSQPSLGGHPHLAQIVSSSIFITASAVGTILAGFIYNRRTKVVRLVAERLALTHT